ncbi:MAG TPA: hypothetical protein VEX36_09335 [Thermoleophilaceae bacterium]|nr:hypothetical protein [Thermoleophilaceae bacterium]
MEAPVQTANGDTKQEVVDTGGESSPDHRLIPMSTTELRLTQLLAGALGTALVIGALTIWTTDDKPTIETRSERSVTVETTPRAEPGLPPRVTRSEIENQTTTASGRVEKGSAALPRGTTSRRSEMVTLAMVAAGGLLIFVGLLLPRLRGASGPGNTSFLLDPPYYAVRKRAEQLAAEDSRLPVDFPELAVSSARRNLEDGSARHRRWRRLLHVGAVQAEVAMETELAEAVAKFVKPPQARTNMEHYTGEVVVVPRPAGDEGRLRRLCYWTTHDDFDVLATGENLDWNTEEGRLRAARHILRHATGNRPVSDAQAHEFAEAFKERLGRRQAWKIDLHEVQGWTESRL